MRQWLHLQMVHNFYPSNVVQKEFDAYNFGVYLKVYLIEFYI